MRIPLIDCDQAGWAGTIGIKSELRPASAWFQNYLETQLRAAREYEICAAYCDLRLTVPNILNSNIFPRGEHFP